MYLGCYHFDGDPAALLPAYQRLLDTFPPGQIQFQVAVHTADGLRVYDACPTREAFDEFSTGAEFAAALAGAGLPAARVEALGEVHTIIATEAVATR
jgi:hypothetical protein